MRTEGSEAYRLDNIELEPQREGYAGATTFRELRGGGLDAEARRPVGEGFLAVLRKAVVAVLCVVAIGSARVALSAATVSALEATQTLQSKVSEAEDLNSDLKIERSVDASSQRIVRIATENYGMVHTVSVDEVDLVPMPTEAQLAETKAKLEQTDQVAQVSAAGAAAMDKFVSREPVVLAQPGSDGTDAAESDAAATDARGDGTADAKDLTPSNAGANAVTAETIS